MWGGGGEAMCVCVTVCVRLAETCCFRGGGGG